ncbi:MAG: Gas vesicle synthesis GvpLGvpF [Gemmatimonadetes bacterium]|nr:Gas vesicle synthesis GvpLGvpF [Gemmatimonadota bacterium]
MSAIRLYGVTCQDGHGSRGATELLAMRDLAAIVDECTYSASAVDDTLLVRHVAVINDYFPERPVLPAPPATVFRSRDHLVRWMELHYVALTEALSYVDNRVVARVHVAQVATPGAPREMSATLVAGGAQALRALRRHSVATVPLRTDPGSGGIQVSAAFLIERELWKEFTEQVGELRTEHSHLTIDVSGPWPPYDFVHMELGR